MPRSREEAEIIADELMALATAEGHRMRELAIAEGRVDPNNIPEMPDIKDILREEIIKDLME